MHIGILVASLLLITSLTGCGGSDSGGNGGDSASPAGSDTEQAPDQGSTFTVTLFASDGGNLSFSGNQEVTAGSMFSVTVTPDTGFRIDSVDGCGGILEDNTFTTEPINGDCTVEAAFTLLSYQVTPTAGIGGSIGPETTQVVDHGDSISFTLLPDVGYQINSVSGCDGRLEDDEFIIESITQDCFFDVTFSLVNQSDFTVTPSAGPGGQISPRGPQIVSSGSSTSFTVEPGVGHEIKTVTGCGGSLEGTTYTTGEISGACSVEATFGLLSYEVTPIAGTGGSLTPDGIQTVNHGDTLSFSVTSDSGYEISSVTGCNGSLAGAVYTTGEVQGDCTVEVSFALLSYSVAPVAGLGGSISPEVVQTVSYGLNTSFTITPESGYEISSVTGCSGSLEGAIYTTSEVQEDCTVEASFALLSYSVTPVAGEGGSISPEVVQTFSYGSNTSFTITPDTGYEIETVTGCSGTMVGTTYTTGAVTGDCSVTASFVALVLTTVDLNDTGIVTCSNYDAEDEVQWTSGLNCADAGATQTSDGIDINGNLVPAGQDAHFGRDARALYGALAKTGGGNAGFDFTKLDASGNALPESAEAWKCVRDNVTGLIWEVKENDGGLHDATDRYNWFDPDTAVNGGSEGFADDDGAICFGYDSNNSDTYCNTLAFTERVNEQGLCGLNSWRLPSKKELRSIIDYQQYSPSIDTQYFPNTLGDNWFWSSSAYAAVTGNVWVVNFNIGIDADLYRNGAYYVRLVHTGM